MNFFVRLNLNTAALLFVLKMWLFFTSHNQMRSIYFISFIYTFFLFDLLSFPINIFGVSQETAAFFIEYFLNATFIIAVIGGIGLLFGISWFIPKKIGWNKLPVISSVIITVLFMLTVIKGAINPIVYSAKEQIVLSFSGNSYITPLKQPIANAELKDKFKFLNKSFESIPQVTSKYQRIIVLVMEGVNHKDYWAESNADKNSFPNKYNQNIISFDKYFTLNLDSYTSLIAMLNNIFVPYQAYVDERKYSFVNEKNNLVRFFNDNGFSTNFLTSYGEQQRRFVPDISEWTQVTCLKNIENLTGYAKVTTSKIEMAAEDLAVFDSMMQIIEHKPKCFIFQEMVYGHTASWKEQIGIETIDYYNLYFTKTVEVLKSKSLDDSTLIIMVSDHGPRDDAYTTENYHIPMLAWAKDLQGNNINAFASHLDFKDILLEFMTGKESVLQQEAIYTLGNSGEFIYGQIMADNKFVFINNRMSNLKSNLDEKSVKDFNQSFQDYLNYFAGFEFLGD